MDSVGSSHWPGNGSHLIGDALIPRALYNLSIRYKPVQELPAELTHRIGKVLIESGYRIRQVPHSGQVQVELEATDD